MASVSKIQLYPSTALTASADGTAKTTEAIQHSFVGWVKATAVNAATTIASKIEHSANGTDWVTLVSFTNIVGTSGFEAKQITDSVLPFVRAVFTLSGATQAATVEMSLYYDKR